MERKKIAGITNTICPITGEIKYGLLLENLVIIYPEIDKLINEMMTDHVADKYCVYEFKDGMLTYCEIVED